MKNSLALRVLLTHNPNANITWRCWVKFKDDIHGGKAETGIHGCDLHVEERERLPTNQPTQGDKEMVPYDACLLGH